MNFGIRTKLVILMFSIVLLVGVSISIYAIYHERTLSLGVYASENREIVRLLSELVLDDLDFNDVSGLRLRLMDAQAHPRILYVYAMNAEGTVLADGSGQSYIRETQPKDPFNQDILGAEDWITKKQDWVLKIGGPVFLPNKTLVGYLAVGFSMNPAYETIRSETLTNLAITAAGLGIGAILVIILATRITRPISQTVDAAKLIGDGNFSTRLPVERQDELGALAGAINQMAERLQSTTISKAYMDDILNFLSEPLIVLTPSEAIRAANPAALSLLGYEETELIERPVAMILKDGSHSLCALSDLMEKGPRDDVETTYWTKDNVPVPVLFSASVMRDRFGQPEGIVCVARNIKRRKQMEEALRQSEQKVRQALEEREQLSRDLHDGILQSMFAVSLSLESSRSLVRDDVKLALRNVDQAIGQLKAVMREVRHFITGPPSGLNYKDNFEANVRALVDSMTAAHPTSVALHIDANAATAITKGQAVHLLNIIREGISNALRHAEAKQIDLSIAGRGEATLVELVDDGVGFDKNAKRSGHGLDNMKARVEMMGGQLEIIGKRDWGTRIVLEIPHESTGVAS